ncbi:hypothetical protein [Bacteroides sp. UBA939]|uniref:hypothetical protein n=1 Tax=Bacteroides sp. UBA939 TaxID=1946092 RepID=UPI0025BF618B|nr:hypothetical protein [Bacteroides sp. UBA939]
MANGSERTVIHLQIGDQHEYFGSPSSMYDRHTAEELGIGQASLNNYFYKLPDGADMVYTNSRCTIRKGVLYVKPTTRGRKKEPVE